MSENEHDDSPETWSEVPSLTDDELMRRWLEEMVKAMQGQYLVRWTSTVLALADLGFPPDVGEPRGGGAGEGDG